MSIKTIVSMVISVSMLLTAGLVLAGTPSPEGAQVSIISPKDGETVSSPVTVRFGLKGMGVAPAGVDLPNTGHHHLLIDVAELPALDKPLPADAQHKHFGGGQTETTIELSSGEHTLQLIMGDKIHIPHIPPVISKKITITVKDK
ncbi:MAG: DUF4399 domain-containing protein [Gammaproteobacteria bacterium]|nr:DUF4399 domain-containing protein [Gammaproteobacteria bacterium]